MLPTLDSLIDKFASKFRIEQTIDKNRMLLVTHSYLGSRIIFTHEMPLDPLYDLLKDRLLNDTDITPNTPPSEK